jgi:SET domain-containing protein
MGRSSEQVVKKMGEIVRQKRPPYNVRTDRYPFAIAKSTIHGAGVFTLANLPARRKIGELTGPLLPVREARRMVRHSARIYLVELDNRWALDCSGGSHLGHVNHCCKPNCYLRIIGKRVEMYTLRRIRANTELTVDYGATPHANGMTCACGSPNCKRKL